MLKLDQVLGAGPAASGGGSILFLLPLFGLWSRLRVVLLSEANPDK